jgi:hypothetical protein
MVSSMQRWQGVCYNQKQNVANSTYNFNQEENELVAAKNENSV